MSLSNETKALPRDVQPSNGARGSKDIKSLLKVSVGGRIVPILIFLATLIAFTAYWLPPGREMLAKSFYEMCSAVRPGFVGIVVHDVELSRKQKVANEKPLGVDVFKVSHAAWTDAGIAENSRITAVDGVTVRSRQDFQDAVVQRRTAVHSSCAKPAAPASGNVVPVCLTIGSTPPRYVAVVPPTIKVPATVDGKWENGPDLYRDLCANPRGPSINAIKEDFAKRNVWEGPVLDSFKGPEFSDPLLVIAGYGKAFFDDVATAMRDYWWTTVVTLASVALFSLIPGIGGLIYRRAFWTWYGLSFVVILALTSLSAKLGADKSSKLTLSEDASALAGGITIFIVAQLVLLLIVYRLRRHTTKMPLIGTLVPINVYNYGVIAALLVLAYGLGFRGWGDEIWWGKSIWDLPFMPFENPAWTKWNVILLGIPFLYAVLKIRPAWSGKKPKNIVVLLDGTSNTPDQLDMGHAAQTNVFKLFSMLKSDAQGSFAPSGRFDATLCKTYDERQVALYYTGIGNSYDADPLVGTLSQATGLGATGIIERAYLDTMRAWRPGDKVYIFGFSRGAASARILARVIDERGAPKSVWSLRLFGRHWTLWPSKSKQSVDVNVLGCWDTVGAFGVGKTIAGINFQQLNLLHDMTVPENVKQAYHMVALDEQRHEFAPTLMEPDPFRPHRMVEVWFSGDHAGVGGGWATDRQSDVALEFLLKRVSSGYCANGNCDPDDESWGLYLSAANGMDEGALQRATPGTRIIHPDPLGQLRSYFSNIYNYGPRDLPLHAVISETVFERMTRSLPVYAPQALFNLNDALDAKRDLITKKVKKLEETQSMDANERAEVLAFAAKLRLTRFPDFWQSIVEGHNPAAGPLEPSTALANKAPIG